MGKWESDLSISRVCGRVGNLRFLRPSFPRPPPVAVRIHAAISIVASVQSCSNWIGAAQFSVECMRVRLFQAAARWLLRSPGGWFRSVGHGAVPPSGKRAPFPGSVTRAAHRRRDAMRLEHLREVLAGRVTQAIAMKGQRGPLAWISTKLGNAGQCRAMPRASMTRLRCSCGRWEQVRDLFSPIKDRSPRQVAARGRRERSPLDQPVPGRYAF